MENGIFHPSWQYTLPVVTNWVSPWAQLMESAILSRHSSTLISPHVEPATVKHSAQSEFKDYTCTEEKLLHKHMDIQVFKFIHSGSGYFYSVVFCWHGWVHHALQDHQNVCIKISKIIYKIYEHKKYCIPYTSYPHTGTYVHKPEKHDGQWTAKVCAQNSTDHNVKYFVLNTCMPNHMFTPSLSHTHMCAHTHTDQGENCRVWFPVLHISWVPPARHLCSSSGFLGWETHSSSGRTHGEG